MSFSYGGVPKYRKHSSGQARVTINGRDYYLGPHGSRVSVRAYDRLVAEFLASGRSPSFGIGNDAYTVGMLMADYVRFARGYFGTGEKSEWHRIKLAIRPLQRLYADTVAAEFGPERFKAVRQAMIEDGLTRQGINARMNRIKRMFKWSAGEGKLPAAVFGTLQLIPGTPPRRAAALLEQIRL
jgi:hypothetical protein